MKDLFRKFSHKTSEIVGSPLAFIIAVLTLLLWGFSGPLFGFSDTWQLVINTATTIISFVMVFLIKNTQNRDVKALHLKLDELIRSVNGARNSMVDLEELSDEELEKLQKQFRHMSERYAHLSTNAGEVAEVVEELEEQEGKNDKGFDE